MVTNTAKAGTHHVIACKCKVIRTELCSRNILALISENYCSKSSTLALETFNIQLSNCVPSTRNKHRDKHTRNKQNKHN